MNEEMPVGANLMRFCFFILHSYFFICFGSSPAPDSDAISPLANFGKCRRKNDE